MSEEECDIVFHDGAAIDLGAAIADTLALAWTLIRAAPSAEEALKAAGVLTEEKRGRSRCWPS